MSQPNKIPRAFAASGDKNSIPDSAGGIGFASWQEGFPAITSEPFANGGVAPKRADFNGIFNALSLATVWQQQGGVYAYDNTTDYEVGNLAEDNGDIYQCMVANGPNSSIKSPSDQTVWSKVINVQDLNSILASYLTTANAASTYLPLSGGTMTGDLVFTAGKRITANSNTSYIALYGGTGWADGVLVQLFGKNDPSNPGAFSFRADNGNSSKTFIGRPDGTLTWGGNFVETNVSNTTAYYRLSSGLQILTGNNGSSSSGPVTVTFSHAFADIPRIVMQAYGTTTTQFVPKCDVTGTTGFSFVCVTPNNTYINGASTRWVAIGIGA